LRLALFALAALLGVAVAVLPGLAGGEVPPSSASFTAEDFRWHLTGGSGTEVTIAPGGVVTFSYPSGSSTHNADFGSVAVPSSCTQTEGASSGSVPPLPHEPTKSGWSGSCTFNTPGTYVFHCDHHPYSMTGTIRVQSTLPPPTTTTTTTGTTPPPPPPTTTTTTPPPPPGGHGTTGGGGSTGGAGGGGYPSYTEPLPVGAGEAGVPGAPGSGRDSLRGRSLRIAALQRGTSVRGSVLIARAGSRLEVDLLATSATLASAQPFALRRVGRVLEASAGAGRLSFSVALDARGRRALARHRRLGVLVRISLTPPHGARLTRTAHVTLRR
jgi:plastocyanin